MPEANARPLIGVDPAKGDDWTVLTARYRRQMFGDWETPKPVFSGLVGRDHTSADDVLSAVEAMTDAQRARLAALLRPGPSLIVVPSDDDVRRYAG